MGMDEKLVTILLQDLWWFYLLRLGMLWLDYEKMETRIKKQADGDLDLKRIRSDPKFKVLIKKLCFHPKSFNLILKRWITLIAFTLLESISNLLKLKY